MRVADASGIDADVTSALFAGFPNTQVSAMPMYRIPPRARVQRVMCIFLSASMELLLVFTRHSCPSRGAGECGERSMREASRREPLRAC